MNLPAILGGDGFPAQDYLLLGGDRSPGKVTLRGANSPRGWDIRKGYALSGATVVPSGDELADGIKALFEFWAASQISAWYAFAAKHLSKTVRLLPGSIQPRALGIYHPVLAAPPISITEVVVKDVTGLEPDGYGGWSCEVHFLQYRKPKPALAAPAAAIPAVAAAAPTAQDAADLEMQRKLAQFQALAEGP
jgi:hypothetical protein